VSESMTELEFRQAVAAAVRGVLNVYREADALLRELAEAFAATEASFGVVAKRITPGVSRRSPDARYLRSYLATVLAPRTADAEVLGDAGDDDDEDGEEDEGEERPTKVVIVPTGGSLVVTRVAIYDPDQAEGFEPNLRVTVLSNCRAASQDVAADAAFRVRRSLFRRIVRAADGASAESVQPKGTATLEGPKKQRTALAFDVATPPIVKSLWSVAPDELPTLAAQVASAWRDRGRSAR
jgi:hypothetical protein